MRAFRAAEKSLSETRSRLPPTRRAKNPRLETANAQGNSAAQQARKETPMAKGQMRKTKEARKPKKEKPKAGGAKK